MWQSKYTADFKLMKSLTKVCHCWLLAIHNAADGAVCQRCQRLSLTCAGTAFTMAGASAHRWSLTMRPGSWRLTLDLATVSYGI
jgi:hypothetical protein